jgi:hypothetical protein
MQLPGANSIVVKGAIVPSHWWTAGGAPGPIPQINLVVDDDAAADLGVGGPPPFTRIGSGTTADAEGSGGGFVRSF